MDQSGVGMGICGAADTVLAAIELSESGWPLAIYDPTPAKARDSQIHTSLTDATPGPRS